MKVSAIGIPWYHESDYETLRGMFEDRDVLHDTYSDWLEAANSLCDHLKSQGIAVEKAYITPKDFPSWCASNRLRLNADARTRFANEFVARKLGHRG